MKNKLPEGWKEVELGEIAECLDGDWILSADMSETGEIGLVQLKHIGEGKFLNKKFNFITKKRCNQLKCTFLKKGDLLVSRMAEPICRSCILPKLDFDTITSVDVTIVRPLNNLVIREYLNILFNSNLIKNQVDNYTTGTTRARISRKNLERLKLILPPLPTQKKIVSILEKAEKAKEWRREADELTKEFLKAVFMEMFGDKKKFEKVKIEETIIQTENENPEREYPDKYFEYVDISSIDNKQGKIITATKILGKEAPSRAKQKIKFNDLLISTVRPNLNSVALVPKELDQQICSTGFCVLRADTKKVFPEYIYHISRSSQFIESMNKIAKGASYPAVSDRDILSYEISLPPLPLQNKFALIVKEVEQMKEQQKYSKEHLNNLFNALMQKAFKCELI